MSKKLFSEISAFVTGDLDPGLFIISGKLLNGTGKAEAEKARAKKAEVKNEKSKKESAKEKSVKKPAVKKIAVKKAPSKKSSKGGHRGIRLKDDSDV